jgi:hypothetical protein
MKSASERRATNACNLVTAVFKLQGFVKSNLRADSLLSALAIADGLSNEYSKVAVLADESSFILKDAHITEAAAAYEIKAELSVGPSCHGRDGTS